MATSGTYDFSIGGGNIVIAAYERIKIRSPSLRQEHMFSARNELNFLQAEWSNKQVNIWKVEYLSIDLVAGTATYDIPTRLVMILDGVITLNNGDSDQVDRYITPLSRTDYASISSKFIEGFPTSYWLELLTSPTITFYPVPDSNGPYVFNYYACVQMQDISIAGGQTPDIPYLWTDALVAGLAYRLSRIYAPEMEQIRKQDAVEAWTIAAEQNTENVPTTIAPAIGQYYRR